MKIAVSILSSNYDEEETIRRINETDAEYIHIDVMDGSFVKESSRHYEYLHTSKKPLNVHLMVSRPFDYISTYKELGAESVTIHAELEDDLDSLLEYIRSLGMKCGLAINPETPISKLERYIDVLDEVLVMSVYPGKGGQKMIDETLGKIDELIELRKNGGYYYEIFVDGGVNDTTISKVQKCDAVISGSYICKSEDYQEKISSLRI